MDLFRNVPLYSRYVLGALTVVAALITLVSFSGIIGSAPPAARALIIFCLLLSVLSLVLYYSCGRKINAPIGIKSVTEGTHFYTGRQIIILDKADAVKDDQVLTLIAISDGIQQPVALLRVLGRTTQRLPQCYVVVSLTPEYLPDYLKDPTRWKSLYAVSEIKSSYLEDCFDERSS